MPSAKEFVDGKINGGKKVVMFSKSWCPYCSKAKKILDKHCGADGYDVIEIENNPDCDNIQNYLQKIGKARSVPRIFINKKCIGGFDDLAKLESQKKLAALLSAE